MFGPRTVLNSFGMSIAPHLLALGLLASATAASETPPVPPVPVVAPAPPATPAAEAPPAEAAPPAPRCARTQACAPIAIERRVGRTVARWAANGPLIVATDPTEATPGPDDEDSAELPQWIQLVWPAGEKHVFSARSETLIAVPRGVVLEISNLVGDINVDAWNRNAVRIVAEHDRRDRMQARVISVRDRAEALRARNEALRDHEERMKDREEMLRDRAEEMQRRREVRRRASPAELRRLEEIDARLQQSTLEVETLTRMGIPAMVDYSITVPTWMALRLSGMETDISVDGVRGAIEAQSIRGDVRVRGGRGGLQLSSVEGEVTAEDCDGDLQLSSINNDVRLDRVSGALSVESINGDIRILKVQSPNVEASSVNGMVLYDGAFQAKGRYRFASHSGNLVVGVPVDAGVDVSVATFQGGFRSGFPVQVGPWRMGKKFNFVLGSGGSTLELESFQGLIELLRPGDLPVPVTPRPPLPAKAPVAPKAPEYKGDK
jgi:hypothetical protein